VAGNGTFGGKEGLEKNGGRKVFLKKGTIGRKLCLTTGQYSFKDLEGAGMENCRAMKGESAGVGGDRMETGGECWEKRFNTCQTNRAAEIGRSFPL